MIHAKILILAVIGDFLWGDPGGKFHPVAIIGRLIARMEAMLYKAEAKPNSLFIRGALASVVVIIISGSLAYVISINFTSQWGEVLQAVALSFMISIRTLARRGMEIAEDLKQQSLISAREKLSYIVSRDTGNLEEQEVVRGTVETMAENFVDGVVAPLFWFLLLGLPGAFAYRAVNTLDAMIGYRNERYEFFGKFAAKLDDLLNYLPARLGGVILLFAGILLAYSPVKAIKIWFNDASKHPSPNSGIPEAIIAGFLGIRLGGYNYYGGKKHFRVYLGAPTNNLSVNHIVELRTILFTASLILTFLYLYLFKTSIFPLV